MAKQTPSSTVGPFFAYGLLPSSYGKPEPIHNHLATPRSKGERILLAGSVTDSGDRPVDDALVEIWQADGTGKYPANPLRSAFRGHGRAATDADGEYRFHTVKPGAREGAPHVCALLFARGLLNHMFTRIYFEDEGEANALDPVLGAAGGRAKTLLAKRGEVGEGIAYRFDFRLGGKNETVFFDV